MTKALHIEFIGPLDRFNRVLEQISYKKGWTVAAWDGGDEEADYYLQVAVSTGACNTTGRPHNWTGRKWRLSPHMTRSEIVQTALMAVLAAEEHEARELFKYRGESIFDPHYDVEKLWELRRSEGAQEKRA